MDGELSRSLIITAGGFGKRMNSEIPKQFLLLQGKPVLQRTIEAFYTFDSSMEIIVVLPETWSNHWEELCHKFEMAVEHRVVIGGSERFYSVKNAIEHATGELVAVHDGVRPLVSQKTIERCFESAQINRASVPVLPVNEIIIAQPCRIVVKEENHHHRENIHDYLHIGHTGLLWLLHVSTIHVRINQRSDCHE